MPKIGRFSDTVRPRCDLATLHPGDLACPSLSKRLRPGLSLLPLPDASPPKMWTLALLVLALIMPAAAFVPYMLNAPGARADARPIERRAPRGRRAVKQRWDVSMSGSCGKCGVSGASLEGGVPASAMFDTAVATSVVVDAKPKKVKKKKAGGCCPCCPADCSCCETECKCSA